MVALNSKNFSSGLHSSDTQYHNNIKKTFFLIILFTHDLRMIRIGLNFLTWPKITFPALLVIFDFSKFPSSLHQYAHVFKNYCNSNQHAIFHSGSPIYNNRITFLLQIVFLLMIYSIVLYEANIIFNRASFVIWGTLIHMVWLVMFYV